MEDCNELLVKVDSGDITPQALVDWAINELQEGKDSESLLELAWQTNPEKSEARDLFKKAIRELDYELLSSSERKLILARMVAQKIVNGEKDINQGCTELGEISRELDSPSNLSVFELLAHEQYDHENLGITTENIRPSILEEARRLLTKT